MVLGFIDCGRLEDIRDVADGLVRVDLFELVLLSIVIIDLSVEPAVVLAGVAALVGVEEVRLANHGTVPSGAKVERLGEVVVECHYPNVEIFSHIVGAAVRNGEDCLAAVGCVDCKIGGIGRGEAVVPAVHNVLANSLKLGVTGSSRPFLGIEINLRKYELGHTLGHTPVGPGRDCGVKIRKALGDFVLHPVQHIGPVFLLRITHLILVD